MVDNKNYSFQYDNGWNINKKSSREILLKHKNNKSSLKLEVLYLVSESRYFSVDEIIDEITYNIEKQNSNYILLSKEKDLFTKYKFNGYKILYENGEEQVLILLFKQSDKLVIINYEAPNEVFDILLDSVKNIVYSLSIKEDTFNLSKDIKTSNDIVNYSKDKEIEEKITGIKTYEIANNNYYVSYSIPDVFKISELNTKFNYFNFKDLNNGSIYLTAEIRNINLYEYLDKDNSSSVYQNYKTYREKEDYTDFKESLSVLDSKYDSYIYKNFYNSKSISLYTDADEKDNVKKNEKVELIFALNKNHILIITIESNNYNIPKKLIDNIKINDSYNYSSYVKINKKDGNLIGELKRFTDYNKNKIDYIKISIPEKYKEYENNNNLNTERQYGLNYDDNLEMFDYKVKYSLTSSIIKDIDGQLNIINNYFSKSYGEYKELSIAGEKTINNKNYIVYNGGYTNLGGIMFTNINRYKYYINKTVLFYTLDTGGYFIIEVSGNGKDITEEILNEITNFTIEKLDY